MKKKLKLNKIKIPVNKPFISNQDIKSVNTVLKNGWISSDGSKLSLLKENFQIKLNKSIQLPYLMVQQL